MSRALATSVAQVGYSPVGMICQSYNRSLVLEFDTTTLFGNELEDLPTPLSRGTRSRDKASVTTFVETMYAHLHANNAFHCAAGLDNETSLLPDDAKCTLAESLDHLIGKAGDIGDKKCKRRRPEWYSIDTVQQRLEVSYLIHYQRGLACGKDHAIITKRKLRIINKDQELPSDPAAVQNLIVLKKSELKASLAKSGPARQEMQNTRILDLESLHQRAKASVVQRINRHEQSAAIWKTLAHFSASSNQRLDRLEIPSSWPDSHNPVISVQDLQDPKEASEWRTITDPFKIEHFLMLRNRMHFGQAQGTPFTVPPLSDNLNWTASTPSADAILQDTFISPPEISKICKQVISACQATTILDQLPATITLESFEGKVVKWRESTTTSPSGRHLGRYKALFAPSVYMECAEEMGQGDYEQFKEKQKAIGELIVHLINFCISNGHVLSRWKMIVNKMIFKDTGVYQIHRLRVIHIYEADFNLLLAVKWRELLHSADRAGIVNKGQYGGRPGHEAQSLALMEELRIDLLYLT